MHLLATTTCKTTQQTSKFLEPGNKMSYQRSFRGVGAQVGWSVGLDYDCIPTLSLPNVHVSVRFVGAEAVVDHIQH